jgi:hypothetical protein
VTTDFSGFPSRYPNRAGGVPDAGSAPDPPFLSLVPALSQLEGGSPQRFAQWPPSAGCPGAVVMRAPAAPEDLLPWTAERCEPRIVFTLQLDEPDGSAGAEGNPLGDCRVAGESLLPLVLAEPPGVSVGKPSAWQSGDDAGGHPSCRILLLPPACRTPRGE